MELALDMILDKVVEFAWWELEWNAAKEVIVRVCMGARGLLCGDLCASVVELLLWIVSTLFFSAKSKTLLEIEKTVAIRQQEQATDNNFLAVPNTSSCVHSDGY